jgi:hypothetical protein
MATAEAIAKRVHPSQVATVEFIKATATGERRQIIELLTYNGAIPGPFGNGSRFEYDALVIEQIAGLCEIVAALTDRLAESEKATATKKKAS